MVKDKKIFKFKWGYILLALLLLVIGVCFIAFNDSIKYLAVAIGVAVILFAAFFAVLAIADKNRQFAFFFKIAMSVAILIAGATVLIAREAMISVIISILGLIVIIDGSFKLHTSAISKQFYVFGWWFITLVAVLLIAVGYVTVKYLSEDNAATMFVLGSILIVDSIANFFSAFYLSGYEKNQYRHLTADNEPQEKKTEEDET